MSTLIFISGLSWDQYLQEGFRTRQGAMLRQFCSTPELKHIIIVTETGWRGKSGIEEVLSPFKIRITQVYVSGALPERFIRFFGIWFQQKNYKLPYNAGWLPEQTLIWSYSIGLGSRLRNLNHGKLFYDVIDYRPNDPNLPFMERILWQIELTNACKFSDRIICNGEIAFSELKKIAGERCLLIRNGIDPERFATHRNNPDRNGVGFVGVISKWIDFDLIEEMLIKLPKVSFLFRGIPGSFTDQIEQLCKYPNFNWGGEIMPSDVPEFLSGCKLAILPYNNNTTASSTGDSMKIFEYLATGTQVITTNFQPFLSIKFSGLINICNSNEEFIKQIKENFDKSPDASWQEKAWEFVQENSWKKRIKQILSIGFDLQSY